MSTLVTPRPNGDDYYERRDELLEALRSLQRFGPVTARTLRLRLGWNRYEIMGKLQSLRMEGLAVYDAGYWSAA